MSEIKSIAELVQNNLTFSKNSYNSGIKEFDKLNIEFIPGQVVLVGSRPSIGRTMFLLYLYHNFWKTNGLPQAYISNEENEVQLVHKLISTTTGIKIAEISEKFGEPQYTYNIFKSQENLLLFDQSSWEDLRTNIIWLIKDKGIKFFYLDKIQGLYCDEKFRNRDQELGFIIREIKKIAVQNEVVFFISSSLSRSVEHREGKHPYLCDIRESGALEEFCDSILLVHRPEVYGITEDDCGNSLRNIAEVFVKKNRNGRTGELNFTFNNKIPRFEEFKGYDNYNFTEQFDKSTGNNNNNTPF
ncbi:MAG TPA: hypothetical protein DHV28_17265 [Ignavibacteriales bacterium]|nr:hypothetical protein [Ignavibacteriales bacterium]